MDNRTYREMPSAVVECVCNSENSHARRKNASITRSVFTTAARRLVVAATKQHVIGVGLGWDFRCRSIVVGQSSISMACLSHLMTTALLEHQTGWRPLKVVDRNTLKALRARGLIYFNRNARPTRSRLTKTGQQVVEAVISGRALLY